MDPDAVLLRLAVRRDARARLAVVEATGMGWWLGADSRRAADARREVGARTGPGSTAKYSAARSAHARARTRPRWYRPGRGLRVRRRKRYCEAGGARVPPREVFDAGRSSHRRGA